MCILAIPQGMCYFEFIFKKSSVPGIVLKRLKQNLETSFPASLKHETRFQNKMNKELIAFFGGKSDSFKNLLLYVPTSY